MMRAPLVLVTLLLVSTLTLHSQTDDKKREARKLALEGVRQTDAGNVDKGLELLRQASQMDPKEPIYRYEQAYAYYVMRDYKHTTEIIEKLLKDPAAQDRWYQLLGNAYDNMGKRPKALTTYNAGLKRFPNSGELYLELGVVSMSEKNYDKAMEYWERGIQHDPHHPSNYYWAAKALCNSNFRIWGVMYGEIFINLEPSTKRTKEISQLLYDTYRAAITIDHDSMNVDFSPSTLVLTKKSRPTPPMRFIYAATIGMATASVMPNTAADAPMRIDTTRDIAHLHLIRQKFLDLWFERRGDSLYPNVLFDWQKKIAGAGHLEAYDYWLLSQGDPDAFRAWRVKNNAKLDALVTWLSANPIRIDREHYFCRLEMPD